MKTQINISNLKKGTLTVLASLLITSVSFTQAGEGSKSLAAAETARLEAFIATTEASLKYEASAYAMADEVEPAMERLEIIAAATDASLKYKAPVVYETEVTAEIEYLDWLVAANEASLKYNAPVIYDAVQMEITTEYGIGNMLAVTTK